MYFPLNCSNSIAVIKSIKEVIRLLHPVFLIDWDNIKIGPCERDLWFYELASVIKDYLALNPNLKINHDLCLYYQTQRLLEDLRMAVETNDLQSFLNHWGWVESYERTNN